MDSVVVTVGVSMGGHAGVGKVVLVVVLVVVCVVVVVVVVVAAVMLLRVEAPLG